MNYLQLPIAFLPHVSRLSGVQVAIWADTWTWEQQGGQAYRTNAQLAEMLGVNVKSISCAITNLRNGGYIEWTMVNGRQRILKAIIPSNVHPPVKRPPSRQTSIPSNVHAASGSTSTLHPVELPCSIPSNVHQVYHVVEQEVNHSVEKEPKPKKAKRERVFHDVALPYDTDAFKAAWKEWLDYKWHQHRFAYKRAQDEQTALHHLQTNSNGNEQLAIHIIAASIASGYQGLFASAAKSFMGPGSRTGRHLRPSGEYANPSDVLKDRNIWG
jgi:hypothetical protein